MTKTVFVSISYPERSANHASLDRLRKEMNAILPPQESLILDTLAKLHSERIRRGISQRELAQKIGMTQSRLAKIELLDSVPSFTTLNRYAAGLGLKLKISIIS
nr:helix-turn-helix transcriptional regulator [Lacticaseibacillus zeae]